MISTYGTEVDEWGNIQNVHYCTVAEAKILLTRRNGQRINITVSAELPTVAGGEPTGRCFPGYGILGVTQKVAVKFAANLLSGFEERGARIQIKENVREGRISLYIGG